MYPLPFPLNTPSIELAKPFQDTEKKQEPILVPTKTEYAFEATKKTIDILKGAAGLVGVPLVKEVLDVGLAMIMTCEASKP